MNIRTHLKTVITLLTLLLCGLMVLGMTACSITPSTVVQKPLTARPVANTNTQRTDGAIFNQAAYRPLFEDRKARYVGDIVTVRISETTRATKATDSEATKDGSHNSAINTLLSFAAPKANFSGNSTTSVEDSAVANASNAFNGLVTATVIEVLPNGFLVISGEKQISLDKGTEFVRFSGVVNPDTITIGNEVSSNKIADARIEYRTNSKIDVAEAVSMFSRFFLSMIPF
jgi:flagellar L-ring protein FlgH